MNLVLASNFEGVASPPWTLTTTDAGTAVIDDSQGAYDGSQALALSAGGLSGTAEGRIALALTSGVRPAPLMYRVKWEGETDESLVVRYDPGSGSYSTSEVLAPGSFTEGVWYKRSFVLPVSVGANGRLSFFIDAGLPPHGFGPTRWTIDLVDIEDNLSSTIVRFMRLLKEGILAVDDAIGSVFISKRRWLSQAELEADAVLPITVPGQLDQTRTGVNVTRFWVLEPRIETNPLTNNSTEYEHVITLTGFYQREEQDTQEVALRQAATMILDFLGLKSAEMTALNPQTDGYMGYLGRMPKMITPVSNAKLDESGIQGHVVQMEVRYFEEVAR